MDIMGFRNMVFRSSHSQVQRTLDLFQPAVGMIEREAQNRLHGQPSADIFGKSVVMPVFFSDSVLLVSSDDSLDSAQNLFFNVRWLLDQAMLHQIPMKGAIAYGQQTADFNKSIHFGRPLIDAYELQAELLLYGAVLHHTMEHYLNESGMMQELENAYLFRSPVHTKTGKITHYSVDWAYSRNVNQKLPSLYETVSGSARRYVDNTLEFLNYISSMRRPKSQNSWLPALQAWNHASVKSDQPETHTGRQT